MSKHVKQAWIFHLRYDASLCSNGCENLHFLIVPSRRPLGPPSNQEAAPCPQFSCGASSYKTITNYTTRIIKLRWNDLIGFRGLVASYVQAVPTFRRGLHSPSSGRMASIPPTKATPHTPTLHLRQHSLHSPWRRRLQCTSKIGTASTYPNLGSWSFALHFQLHSEEKDDSWNRVLRRISGQKLEEVTDKT
jgi:hypothetical protein